MTSVDINRLKGNYAQALVMTWLSRKCLVRPVAEGTDIGIDLYCEAVVDGSPYLHFWVQVKAIPSTSLRMINEKTTASYPFDTRHLAYWDRQPIPVYAMLVPLDSWPPVEPDTIYGVRITEQLVRDGLPSRGSVTYHTTDGFEWDSLDRDLDLFVTKIVPWDTSALLLKRGIVAPLPGQPAQPNSFTLGIGYQYLPKMLENMRDTAVQGIFHSLLAEQSDSSAKPVRKHFEIIAETFEGEMHNFGLSMLVRSAHADGDTDRAKAYIQRALARIASDTSLEEPERLQRLDEIRVLLTDFDDSEVN